MCTLLIGGNLLWRRQKGIYMRYFGSAVSDVGNTKKTNQDSICIRIAREYTGDQIAMIVMCDGMGGYEKGELASASVIRAYCRWFDEELPDFLKNFDWTILKKRWEEICLHAGKKIREYGVDQGIRLGTTLSAMFIYQDHYMIIHVGDSRIYQIDQTLTQLTTDHSFVEQEVRAGRMTREAARTDKRRNMLLQSVGASEDIFPEIRFGTVQGEVTFMFCSDGLVHELSDQELYQALNPSVLNSPAAMEYADRMLVNMVKQRNERDNVTIGIIRTVV